MHKLAARRARLRASGWARWAALSTGIVLAACGGGDGAGGGTGLDQATPAVAFGIWNPGPNDTCTKEQHDAYATVGPDGKRYPTWHPPTGPGGCTFGHDHGRDPRGSRLYGDVGDLPFGYANEQLALIDPNNPRNEDHVGHKVEWENDMEMQFSSSLLQARCDVLTKLHQGTHSRDAFANNVHELNYYIRCTDGTRMDVTMLTAIGNPGEFRRSCDRNVVIQAGRATPLNSPRGGGFRAIPDRFCIERHLLVANGENSNYHNALHETWETSNSIRMADGRTIASFNPYYQVRRPSRFFDSTQAAATGRPIAACYEVLPDGRQARGGECITATNNRATAGITFDDARSPFNGVRRFVDINSNNIDNEGGSEIVYTDPYGRNGQTQPFPGSIRQRIATIRNQIGPISGGPIIGNDRDYGGPGVRAPN